MSRYKNKGLVVARVPKHLKRRLELHLADTQMRMTQWVIEKLREIPVITVGHPKKKSKKDKEKEAA